MAKGIFLLFFPMLFLGACLSTKDAGRLYFNQGNKVKGVEPVDTLLERMKQDQKLREIMYGQVKSARIVQCTLLRNQLYVAASKGSKKEIEETAKIMEMAYQENDAAFLAACDKIISTDMGKTFMAIQQEYLQHLRKR